MELIIMGCFMCISFFMGFYLGKPKTVKNEIKKIIPTKKKKVVEEQKKDAMTIMLENIDNYDGTGLGQQDIPDESEEW